MSRNRITKRATRLKGETVEPRRLLAGDLPVAHPDSYEVAPESGQVVIAVDLGVLSNDVPNQLAPLTATLVEAPSNGQLALAADGSFTYAADQGFFGKDTFTYQAQGAEASNIAEVTLDVLHPIRITEFLAANVDGFTTRTAKDEGGNFTGDPETPDWIELHNRSNQQIDIGGYHLTDDSNETTKWTFPQNTMLVPNERLVVYASKLNVTDPALDESGRLHTNFKLSLEGDYLGLAAPDGEIVEDFGKEYPRQYPNVSYGWTSSGNVGYLKSIRPEQGDFAVYVGAVGETTANLPRGFYNEPIQVSLATKTPGAQIRYTTDGSLPSATNGQVYVGPVAIGTTTTLRSIALKANYVPSQVTTHSYLFVDDVVRQTDELTPDGDFVFWTTEMDPQVVDSPSYKDLFDESLKSIPTLSVTAEWDDLFGIAGIHRGQNLSNEGDAQRAGDPNHPQWIEEQDVSVELIYPEGDRFLDEAGERFEGFHINAGLRIQGGGSRWFNGDFQSKQSFGLRFREEYGASQLNYPFFEAAPFHAENAADQFDSLVLRAGTNKNWAGHWDGPATVYTRDQFGRDLQIAASGVGSHGTFVHLYLNGIYWGLYNPSERPDANFASTYLGGDDEDWFALKSKGGVISGDPTRFEEWIQLKSRTDDFEELQEYLAVDEYIDMALTNVYADVGDFPQLYAGNRNDVPGPIYHFNWDMEDAFGGGSRRTSANPNPGLLSIIPAFQNVWSRTSDFRIRFADRAYAATKVGGTLSDAVVLQMWDDLTQFVEDAVVAESARWGDAVRNTPYTREPDWQNARQAVRDDLVDRSNRLITSLRETELLGHQLYPSIDPSVFNRVPGVVSIGTNVLLGNPNDIGNIYYTVDGSDPRNIGGGVSASAKIFNGTPIQINDSQIIKTRVRHNGEWSAMNDAAYTVSREPSVLISEIMYNPGTPSAEEFDAGYTSPNDFEFIEVHNYGDSSVNLLHYQFTDGFEFTFPSHTLDAGGFAVVARNVDAFVQRYGSEADVIGQFESGGLSNGGERLTLVGPTNEVIVDFAYNDTREWPQSADGAGASLHLDELIGSNVPLLDQARLWVGSLEGGGSPGRDEGVPSPVVINEVLANTTEVDGVIDAIEIHNTSNKWVNIGGWYLSDSADTLLKYQFQPNQAIAPNGFLVVSEDQFNSGPNAFALSGNKGEEVWLVSTDGDHIDLFADNISFTAAAPGESLGRTSESEGRIVPLLTTTLGQANSEARIGPLTITEINYNPGEPNQAAKNADPAIVASDLEFVEINNTTNQPVDLTDWRIRGGIDFDFAPGTVLPAGETLAIVSIDPINFKRLSAFKAHYGIDQHAIVGPYVGKLNNAGDRVVLQRPGNPPIDDPTLIPRFVEDEVIYDDESPWPVSADGLGKSLHRVSPFQLGHLSTAWQAGPPSFNTLDTSIEGDFNADGQTDDGDIDHLCNALRSGVQSLYLDINTDGVVTHADFRYLIGTILNVSAGDANMDGAFTSEDLLQTFKAGGFEDKIGRNSTWATGDWNCDQEFGTSDLVAAFKTGAFIRAATSSNQLAAAVRSDETIHVNHATETQDQEQVQLLDEQASVLDRQSVDLLFQPDVGSEALELESESEIGELDPFRF